jgi:hypothetical protein
MLEIRNKDNHVAFKMHTTIAAVYYRKQQDQLIISDILQGRGLVSKILQKGGHH